MKIVADGRQCGVKASMYEASGYVYAGVAVDLGLELQPSGVKRWASIMKSLATADSLVETDSDLALDVESLLALLTLENTTENREIIIRLAEASVGADQANTIKDHFDAREEEARACAAIFQQATEYNGEVYQKCWDELGRLAVAGIMLDSLCDSVDDARRLPQFSAAVLFTNSFSRFCRISGEIQLPTWRSVLAHSRRHGLDAYIATKPIRIVGSLIRSS